MTTIETEHGKFEGETLAEANRKARAAARAQAKLHAAENAACAEAYDKAKLNGFAIHQQVGRSRRGAHGDVILSAPCRAAGVEILEPTRPCGGGHQVRYYGSAEYDHWGYEIVAVILDACGWCMGVITRDVRLGGESVLAVGVASGGAGGSRVVFVLLEVDAAELRRLAGDLIEV